MNDQNTAGRLGFRTSARDANDRVALVEELQARPGQQFLASDLKRLTAGKARRPQGVPQSRVRDLLTDVNGVAITKDSRGFWFSWTASREGGFTKSG